jgi:hypothetical protein
MFFTPTAFYNLSSANTLKLTFDNITNADLIVGDSSNLNDWNTFFDLPNLGRAFTKVEIVGNTVRLLGGKDIKVKPALMYAYINNTFLIKVEDIGGCITSVGGDAFSYCTGLTDVNLPACLIVYGFDDSPQNDYGGFGECTSLVNLSLPLLTLAGNGAFYGCNSLTTISLPLLALAGDSCFYSCTSVTTLSLPQLTAGGYTCFSFLTSLATINLPQLTSILLAGFASCTSVTTINLPACTDLGGTVGNDSVFSGITGQIITLTVPSALITCNSGDPDGDIDILQTNNTVTVITV